MAWDTLAIPTMSAECERIFSSAAQLVTTLWNGLKEDMIEVNECLGLPRRVRIEKCRAGGGSEEKEKERAV